MQEVIAVHDSVMPEMGEIGQLISQLKPLADSTTNDSRYQDAISDLQASQYSHDGLDAGFWGSV